jgi:HlyD family secretion protein
MTAIELSAPEPSLRRLVIAGFAAVGIGFGGFLVWGFAASLDSAAVAHGTIVVDSHRKTVQHYEGGILRELLVREGDVVEQGQVLLRLDPTLVDATVIQTKMDHYTMLAGVARLRAEEADAREIRFPDELVQASGDEAIAALLASQRALFDARWTSYHGEIAVRRKKIEQVTNEVEALNAQVAATRRVIDITEKQITAVRKLLSKGYERLPRLQELESAHAEQQGRIGELVANIAGAQQMSAGLELEIANLESTRKREIADELQQVLASDAASPSKLRAAEDVRRRLELRAPQAGRVVDLQIFTPGGVIEPGKPILDIVPLDDDLIVEARVKPSDIDVVRAGLPAEVRLLAYKQRKVPPVKGDVITVSAGELIDERTGDTYFTARIRLDLGSLPPDEEVELYPGMPAEVLIATGTRRAISYFIAPVTESWHRAFREE